MTDEPKAMRELHEIRERLSEEARRMTPQEHTTRVNRSAEKLAKKYGFSLVPSANPRHVRSLT